MPKIIRHFHEESVTEEVDGESVEVTYTICDTCDYRYKRRALLPLKCTKCQRDLWNWRELTQEEMQLAREGKLE